MTAPDDFAAIARHMLRLRRLARSEVLMHGRVSEATERLMLTAVARCEAMLAIDDARSSARLLTLGDKT